jgi:hypothetical protein
MTIRGSGAKGRVGFPQFSLQPVTGGSRLDARAL